MVYFPIKCKNSKTLHALSIFFFIPHTPRSGDHSLGHQRCSTCSGRCWGYALIKNSVLMKHLQESLDAEKPLTYEDVANIEVLLDEVNPDFLPTLKQLGEMTDIEYQVSLLIRLGMSPIQISSLVLRDKSSVSAIRRRLYKKITGQNGNPADWDNIVLSI